MMKISRETQKNIALCEKIEMYLMLKEQYDSFIKNGRLKVILNSYKNERKLRQIYLAYLYVVIENLEKYEISNKEIKELLSTKYNINNTVICFKTLLKDYRNKTFHNTLKDYYNEEGLYKLDLINCSEEVEKITEILKQILEKNKKEESNGTFIKMITSKYAKKASQIIGGGNNE